MVRRPAVQSLLSAILLPVLMLAVRPPARAQLILGQYEDEAPLRTWNGFGLVSASGLGLGGVQFARASDSAAATTNPALLVSLPSLSVTLTAAYSGASMFRYSLVNTGVVFSRGNLSTGYYALEFGGFSARLGRWAVAAAAGILESYGRPPVSERVADQGTVDYSLDLTQRGFLRGYNFSVARSLTDSLAAGLGVNIAAGRLDRSIVEWWAGDNITISDERSEKPRGVFLNGGVTWDLTSRIRAAVVVRSPYVRKAKAGSISRYLAPDGNTDIRIDAEAENEYRQPWICGAGFNGRISRRWTLAADLAWFGWGRYAVTYFEESLVRSFRNVLRLSAGAEYRVSIRIGRRPAELPLRFGFCHDPQPMSEPRSAYLSGGLGAGLKAGALTADVAAVFGQERGSGHSLRAGRIAVTVSYDFRR